MRWLIGHKKDVRGVAYTPDGQLVSGGSDLTVRVWDPVVGECVRTIRTANVVYAVAVSPDGSAVAYAGRYPPRVTVNTVSLIDRASGRVTGRYELRAEGEVVTRNPATGWPGLTRGPVPRSIWALTFSADGRYLAAACRQLGAANHLNGAGGRVWETANPQTPVSLPGEDTYTVAFAPAGHRLAVTRSGAVHFLADPRAAEGVTYPLTAWAPAVAFVPGADLAAVAAGSFVFFVNPVRREKPTKVKVGVRTVSALAAAPDGRTLFAGGRPGTVEVFDTATRTRTATYDFGVGGVHGLAVAPDGLTFAVAGDKGLVVCDAHG